MLLGKTRPNYTLMHKNISVCDVVINEDSGYISKICKMRNFEHMPPGTKDKASLGEWWENRKIPASRNNLEFALNTLGLVSTLPLAVRCMGLSLSDHYWIKPYTKTISWESVNFFQNDFSDDIGELLFGNPCLSIPNLSSPSNTSDGVLQKKWKIKNGTRVLIKGGTPPFYQQPLNEVIASELMTLLNIPHVSYSLLWDQGIPYSVCEDFVSPDSELIPMSRLVSTSKSGGELYEDCVRAAEAQGIRDAENFLDKMLIIDFLLANEDRHLNNFGILRNPDTLKGISFAPMFDTGSSLGYRRVTGQINNVFDYESRPFFKTHREQLFLARSFDFVEPEKLLEFADKINELLKQSPTYIDTGRRNAIVEAFKERCTYLKEYVQKRSEQNFEDFEIGR